MASEVLSASSTQNVTPTDATPSEDATQTVGTYMGRLVRWLNNTPEGNFTKGVGYIAGAAAIGMGALFVFKAALITALFSAILSSTVIGIPYALIGFGFAGGLIAFTSEIFKLAGTCLGLAADHFKKVYPN